MNINILNIWSSDGVMHYGTWLQDPLIVQCNTFFEGRYSHLCVLVAVRHLFITGTFLRPLPWNIALSFVLFNSHTRALSDTRSYHRQVLHEWVWNLHCSQLLRWSCHIGWHAELWLLESNHRPFRFWIDSTAVRTHLAPNQIERG